jgi:uncharacterized membrane-anchored protein
MGHPVFRSHFTIPETWYESIKEKQSIKLMSTQIGPSRTATAINGLEKILFKNKQENWAIAISIQQFKYLCETSAKTWKTKTNVTHKRSKIEEKSEMRTLTTV